MAKRFNGIGRVGLALLGALIVAGCGDSPSGNSKNSEASSTKFVSKSTGVTPPINPNESFCEPATGTGKRIAPGTFMFAAQVPFVGTDRYARSILAPFQNHDPLILDTPRGGGLHIRYPNGTVRNLTGESGFGGEMDQSNASAVAVREPYVHHTGTRALFSMVLSGNLDRWQIYEITGFGQGEIAKITKIANQPSYNNISPIYGSDDSIIFTSDRPRSGLDSHYPQRDEYESQPTTTGIWKLQPQVNKLVLLNHTPSGAFKPIIDSFGRIVFTRWDHLVRDQQVRNIYTNAFDYLSESNEMRDPSRTKPMLDLLINSLRDFPEPKPTDGTSDLKTLSGKSLNRHDFNMFVPWQMNQDGTEEETLNHIGSHELRLGATGPSFFEDKALKPYDGALSYNGELRYSSGSQLVTKIAGGLAGIFHLRESATQPGLFFGIVAHEFGNGAGRVVRFYAPDDRNNPAAINPNKIQIEPLMDMTVSTSIYYRSPTWTSADKLVATVAKASYIDQDNHFATNKDEFRIQLLCKDPVTKFYRVDTTYEPLTRNGLKRVVTYKDPSNSAISISFPPPNAPGTLWELDAVEVASRINSPSLAETGIEAPEKAAFKQAGVDESQFRTWLKANDSALIVTRDNTSRDAADVVQPFNLVIPGSSRRAGTLTSNPYAITDLQIFQAEALRGYDGVLLGGRRSIPVPLNDTLMERNPLIGVNSPKGSVKIEPDGSTAAIVPASRALTWHTMGPLGAPNGEKESVVKERVWVTFQPGEVRVCASCHGINTQNQFGEGHPTNTPQALTKLLQFWKAKYAPVSVSTVAFNGPATKVTGNTLTATVDATFTGVGNEIEIRLIDATGSSVLKSKLITLGVGPTQTVSTTFDGLAPGIYRLGVINATSTVAAYAPTTYQVTQSMPFAFTGGSPTLGGRVVSVELYVPVEAGAQVNVYVLQAGAYTNLGFKEGVNVPADRKILVNLPLVASASGNAFVHAESINYTYAVNSSAFVIP
jgi:Hydrazine synthase alpha subunit middle domain